MIRTVRLLLEREDTDPNAVDNSGRTALSLVAERGHVEMLRELLKSERAPLNFDGMTEGTSPLFSAIKADQDAVVDLLSQWDGLAELMMGTRTTSGRTALSLACERGILQIVKVIHGVKGVHPNTADAGGNTPLCWAADKGHDAVVEHLISVRADPNHKTPNGWTPLHFAAKSRSEAVINTLLPHANANAVAEDGATPLVAALRFGANRQGAVRLLLPCDCVSLHEQLQRRNDDMVQRLLDIGYNINMKDTRGRTPLHVVVMAEPDRLAMAAALLASDPKPDLTIEDTDGLTPLRLALRENQIEPVELFLKSITAPTPNINAKDWLRACHPSAHPIPLIKVEEKVGEGIKVAYLLSDDEFSEELRSFLNSTSSAARRLL